MDISVPNKPTLEFYTGEDVFPVWQEVAYLVDKAADWGRGEYVGEDVLVMVSEKKMQLWLFRDEDGKVVLVCVTQILEFPRRKVCNIYALAGRRMAEMWALFSLQGRKWLEVNGVEEIQTTCRTEIAEKIKPLGFEPLVHVMRLSAKEQS